MIAREEISAYLLGELSADDRAAFERAAAADPELRDEVERLRPVVTRLEGLDDAAWEPAAAPALPRPAPRRRALTLRPAIAALAAVVLLLAGVGAGLLLAGDEAAPEGVRVALAPVDGAAMDAGGEARLDGSAAVELSGLEPSADGEFYELWLLNSADDLVSLGSFRVPASGEAELTVPLPGDPAEFRFVDLSIEPGDGDPRHSGRSVLRGSVEGAQPG